MAHFITFEGPEGSGKTTQTTLLQQALVQDGLEVMALREPGGTVAGEAIRQLLLNRTDTDLHPRTETLLFSAARAQLVAEVIRPALEQGRTVLCDRFSDSTLAYQGFGYGQSLAALEPLITYATDGLVPSLRIYLNLPPAAGLRRVRQNQTTAYTREWNRLDAKDLAYHEAVYAGYRELMAQDPAGWHTVDALQTPEDIHAEILAAVHQHIAHPAGMLT